MNLFALQGMVSTQYLYLRYSKNYNRYALHKSAMFNRYILNQNFIKENRKKPNIH